MKKNALLRLAVCAVFLLGLVLRNGSAYGKPLPSDPLPSWNDTDIKKSLIKYVKSVTNVNANDYIPVEDRIAVFDMDGTIACEWPLWFTMYAAIDGLNRQSAKDPKLMNFPEYQYAKKLAATPGDISFTKSLVNLNAPHPYNYIDTMIWRAYKGVDNEEYIRSAKAYLTKTQNKKFNIFLADMFYQPMIELIQYLKQNKFEVYIVSGSTQGIIWSVCPEVIGLDRAHLLGTRQALTPVYKAQSHETVFRIKEGYFTPENDHDGKSMNIYSRIGKTPVFAFGNTTGDFGMFHLTSTSKYRHMALLLNHDDKVREYAYPPYHDKKVTAWRDSLSHNNWKLVDMSKNFKVIWKTANQKPSH